MKKIFHALAASSLLLTPVPAGAQASPAAHDDHAHARAGRVKDSAARRRASRARKRAARRSVVYVCLMHPDMRSRTRGECPKCGMALVAAGKGEAVGAGDGQSNR